VKGEAPHYERKKRRGGAPSIRGEEDMVSRWVREGGYGKKHLRSKGVDIARTCGKQKKKPFVAGLKFMNVMRKGRLRSGGKEGEKRVGKSCLAQKGGPVAMFLVKKQIVRATEDNWWESFRLLSKKKKSLHHQKKKEKQR